MSRSRNGARRRGRIQAFLALYGTSFSPVASLDRLKDAFLFSAGRWQDLDFESNEKPVAEDCQEQEIDGFAWSLAQGVWQHEKELDQAIERFSHHWRVDRMGKIELTLLRLAMYEIAAEISPPRVAIKEALDLAVLFGADRAAKFMNGILDQAARAAGNGFFSQNEIR